MKKTMALVLFATLLIVQAALAAPPHTVSYQGILEDGGGALVPDGDYDFTFSIYDVGAGGSALWTESQTLPVTNGVFDAVLGGAGTPIDLGFDQQLWLGVQIAADPELAPRVPFTSAGSALNSDRLDGLHASSFAGSGHTHQLGGLSDVNTSGAVDGDVLGFAGGNWFPQAIGGGEDGDWTIVGGNMYSNVSGNVGIGTTLPDMKLHIRSDVNGLVGIKIQNNDTGANSVERISFVNEEGDIAGIALFDDNNASYPGRMSIFNNRNLANINVSTPGGGIYIANNGDVGVGTTAPSAKLDVVGTAELGGMRMATGAVAGRVLTSDASGNASWQAPVAADDGDWIISGDDVYRNTGSVGIGGPPLRIAADTSKGGGVQERTPATTKLMVSGLNEGIYAYMQETDILADDRAAVYGYRTRNARNDGTGYAAGGSNAGVIGANYWGDSYTFGVAGYSYNDYSETGGVLGADWSGSNWGALGYKDASFASWGIYTPDNAYVGGTLTANGKIRNIGDFGGGYGGAALVAESTNAGGIAVWAETSGSDATLVLDQNGTGDMCRGFLNGAMKFRVLNNGSVVTPLLQITGGADLAEPFDVGGEQGVSSGALLVIDDENPGKLKLSDREYDSRVAGVVSGAGGVNPGLTLSQQDVFEGGQNVALSGRVYAMADVSNGPIRPGDLLTTSSRPGHAMRATDRDRSHGAVIGKAMSVLDEGEGLVLVLVNLQ